MGHPNNRSVSAAALVIALLLLIALITIAIGINGVERTAEPEDKPRESSVATDPYILIDPVPQTTPTLASGSLVGMPFLDENCAVKLVLSNDAAIDTFVVLRIDFGNNFDESEKVVPAQGMLTLTLVRDQPITHIFVADEVGSIVDWEPDYSVCPNGPAVSPGKGTDSPDDPTRSTEFDAPVLSF